MVIVLVFIVISLGTFTRLTNSGLSCPDWPGCYGKMTVPTGAHAVKMAENTYGQKVVEFKAWAEMIHRYVAGILGFLLLTLFMLVISQAFRQKSIHLLVPMFIAMVLLLHQIMLGLWTVTLKLMPVIVSLHLLTAFLILATLWWVYLRSKDDMRVPAGNKIFKLCAFLGLILVFLQIALGAWTSSNYAAVSCAGFPFCHVGDTPMHYDFQGAFNFISPIGINYEGGVLSSVVRQTIQMIHRYGALLVSLYLLGLFFMSVYRQAVLFKVSLLMIGVLSLQVIFGILNVLMHRPLEVAVLHNLAAALLLLALISFNYRLYFRPAKERLL